MENIFVCEQMKKLLLILLFAKLTFGKDINILFLIRTGDQTGFTAALAFAQERIANESLLPADYVFRYNLK
jgi:hypothetical protein